ncbi:hypothetical protein LSAT2_030144 [Lamellibrachia satsuma]|nr:hypothetical protein LSAT2_030144 [Lamellibrachia satsuma]
MTSVAPAEVCTDDDSEVEAANAAQHTRQEHALAKKTFRRGVRRETTHRILLSVPVFLALVITALYSTFENVDMKNQAVSLDNVVKSSEQLSRLTLQLQRERDQLVLYNSQIGADSKTFLLRSYAETDRVISSMTEWPVKKTDDAPDEFSSKLAFHRYIVDHRIALEGDVVNVKDEVLFYSRMINKLIEWLHDAISKVVIGDTWQILVSYQNIVSSTEDVGVIRAIGTTYFADGYFRKRAAYQLFNQKCGSLIINYDMTRKFTSRIPLLKKAVNDWSGYDVYTSVNQFIRRIQTQNQSMPSVETAATWFDSMSAYVDTLRDMQTGMWEELIRKLNEATVAASSSISFSGSVSTAVCLLWPAITYFFYWNEVGCCRMAASILENVREVAQARIHDIAFLCACLPRHLVTLMRENTPPPPPAHVPVMTMMVVQAVDLHGQSVFLSPQEVIGLLNEFIQKLWKTAEEREVFVVTQENDTVLITAEKHGRGPQQEARIVVNFAVEFIAALRRHTFLSAPNGTVAARIGVQTGTVLSWISGLGEREQPCYRVTQEPVFAAQTFAETAEPNSIRVGAEVMALMDADEEYEFDVADPVDVLIRQVTLRSDI